MINYYPLLQRTFCVADGQYDPGEQKISLLLATPVQTSALPQVCSLSPGGAW